MLLALLLLFPGIDVSLQRPGGPGFQRPAAAPAGEEEVKGPYDGAFVLRGVSVWTPDGVVADRSLLLRNGLIEAVGGPELAAPPEARQIEAQDGWTAYPGWIHADLGIGVEATPPTPFSNAATDARDNPIPGMEWGNRKDLRAWMRVADTMLWDPAKTARWREAGCTSGYVLPRQGLLRGQAAWVSLNDKPLGDALLQADGLQTVALQPAGGGYPSTSMAALAVLRQAFLDAQRLQRVAEAGAGRTRPDPDLAALLDHGQHPLLFLANSTREIENALDLARDYAGGRPLVILGGRDAYKLAPRLLEQKAAVLFRLELEDAPKSDEDLKVKPAEERPWWQEPARLREDRRAEHALRASAFRKLRDSGVPCALVPSGQPKDFRDDLAQLLKDGMQEDDIHRALTSDVARILQLGQVGAVAAGQGADLVLSRGPWNLEKPDLAWVFADGRGWEFPAKEKKEDGEKKEGEAAPEGGAAIDPAVYGDWEFETETPGGTETFHVVVSEDGTVESFRSEEPDQKLEAKDVTIEGNVVSFSMQIPDMDMTLSFRMEASGDQADATLSAPFGSFPAEGRRVSAPAPPAPPAPPQAAPDAPGKTEESQEDDDAKTDAPTSPFPPGHPEYPIETRADRKPHTPLDGNVLLRGAMLYPMTGQEPYAGDLLIRDGRIAAVGASLPAPEGVTVLEADGWHVTPGVIDPHSHLGIDSTNEGAVSISAECRMQDMVHPEEVEIYRAAAGGTAIHQTLHGSANPIGGQAAVWELDVNRETIAELLLPGAPQGIKFALGENVKQSNFDGAAGNRFPNTRAGVQAVYERAFTRAQEYAAARRKAAQGGDPGFRRDVRLDALADILEGKIHIQCHSYRADEILMFLGICRQFGIAAPTFQHVLEGYKVAPELAAYGAMASTFSDWWAYKIEAYDAIPWNAYLMTKAGVVATINSDSGEMIRRLNTEAGKSLRYGPLSHEQALALCTLNAAKNLHIADRVGTLETGKDGTVSCFDGPPLSTYSRCVLTVARGRILFQRAPGYDQAWSAYAQAVKDFAAAHPPETPAAVPQHQPSDEEWQRWTRPGQGQSTLIRNCTVHPVSAAPYAGEVLIQDGRIGFAGAQFAGALPEGCTVVDAGGMHLYPGLMDCGNSVGLYEIGSVAGTLDSNDTGNFQPDLSYASALHPDSAHIGVHRMTGITHVLVGGGRGRISGQLALIQLDGETPAELAVMPDLGLHVRFPNVARPDPGKEPEDPADLKELDRWFDEARAYGERRDRCAAAGVPLPERDLKYEALLPYARGERPVFIEADGQFSVLRAVRWAQERQLNPVFVGLTDAWKVAGHLGAQRARVILGSVHALPRSDNDPYDSPFRGPWILAEAGCEVALRTDDPETARNLPFQAATAAAHGLGSERALYALTLGAARLLGVDAFTGSIEAGKAANLFLAESDPLDFPGRVRRMWIGGQEVPLVSKQTELRDRYEARIERAAAPPR
ncbi:MAG: hypothetical protein EYC70_11980 [Planctomycetota bacterium]|nr:MAG: hypothetical protein EYC70_11980 [Planctomycetota bacterium]